MPHRSYPTHRSPSSAQQRGHPPDYILCAKGSRSLTLARSCTVRVWPVKQKQIQTHLLQQKDKTTSRRSGRSTADVCRAFGRTTTRRAHTVIPRVGSAYRPLRPLKSSAEPFIILINLRDNRYRCLDLTDPRSTTAVRTTRTSVPALSSHQVSAVTNKVNSLLTLSRVCS